VRPHFSFAPVVFATIVFAAFVPEASGASPLPKTGRVALVLQAADPADMPAASIIETEDMIRRGLIAAGYTVVDERKLERIRRDRAALLALEGNAEGILRLGARYGVNTFVRGNVSVHASRKNDANLYTATAVISVRAVASSAAFVFSETIEGRDMGYTPQDARHRALAQAAKTMEARLAGEVRPSPTPSFERSRLRLVVRNIPSFQQANAILETCRTAQGTMSAAMKGYGEGAVTIEVDFVGDAARLRQALLDRGLPLSFAPVSGTTLEAVRQ
jgi:hypothetical protein